jgi:hypothetical protein
VPGEILGKLLQRPDEGPKRRPLLGGDKHDLQRLLAPVSGVLDLSRSRRYHLIFAWEEPPHQLSRGLIAGDPGIEARKQESRQRAGELRREHTLRRGVKAAHIQGPGVAKGHAGGAGGKRLVDVDQIKLDGAQDLLDRARHIDRQRRGAAPRARKGEHLTNAEHQGPVGSLIQ